MKQKITVTPGSKFDVVIDGKTVQNYVVPSNVTDIFVETIGGTETEVRGSGGGGPSSRLVQVVEHTAGDIRFEGCEYHSSAKQPWWIPMWRFWLSLKRLWRELRRP